LGPLKRGPLFHLGGWLNVFSIVDRLPAYAHASVSNMLRLIDVAKPKREQHLGFQRGPPP
jgi:hypothetical protein